MKTILKHKFVLLLLAGAFALAACNKEEQDPFAGKDSYITAFSLQQGETVFHAAIAGDVITVTVPEGFSLEQAKATVKLSENAAIYPDPTTITDWNNEQQFAVTAHNGAKSTYKYTVARSGIAHNGTIVLETQADVDAFGQRGVTFIDGNLTIGRTAGEDSITSLAPLASLKEVVYAFTLQPTCAITALDGLENLERVGGVLQFGGTTTATGLKHLETLTLPALKQAGSISLDNTITFIIELPALERVSKLFSLGCPHYQLQLPRLQYAGTLTLAALSNASTSLAQIDLPALEEVEGNITVSNLNSVTKLNLPELKKAGGFSFGTMTLLSFIYAPKLEETTGTMTFATKGLTEISFPALRKAGTLTVTAKNIAVLELPKLETAEAITLNNVPLNGSINLTALKTAKSISLTGVPVSIADFTALESAGTITLSNLSGWTTVTIPAGVQRIDVFSVSATNGTYTSPLEVNVRGKNIGELQIGVTAKVIGDDTYNGTLRINGNGYNQTFPELEGFSEVDTLSVVSASMMNVHIKGIRKIKKSVNLTTNYSGYPYEFSMPDIEEIGGNFTVNYGSQNAIMDTIRFDNLIRVGGNFTFRFIGKIKVLDCPELTTVGGNFDLNTGYDYSIYYQGFETLNFPELTTIDGKLTLHTGSTSYSNSYLQNLDGFAALTSVKAIEITRQTALTDYTGLQQAFSSLASPDDWKATGNAYNPTYQDLKDGGKWTK
ncbi:MAG: DUF5018 domain-containing protein [Prevotellaceae bacterium]|jgi:hypothetical protein|nr:DUF5018 domain-containing protein [Prevotellaceae bacterium]